MPSISKQVMPDDRSSAIGVRSFTLPPMAARPCLQRARQLVDPVGDARLADRQVKPERLRQRPAVLERVKTTGRHARARRQRLGRLPLHPQLEGRPFERRDDPLMPLPGVGAAPDDPGAARAEQPFVAAGDEEVAAEIPDGLRLDAEAVHAVDAQEHAIGLGALLVHVGERVGHPADRQLHARRRMHPGDGDRARARADALDQVADDLVGGCLLGNGVEGDLADGGAGVKRAQAQRLIGRRSDRAWW